MSDVRTVVTVTRSTTSSAVRQPRSIVVKVPGPQGSAGTSNIGTVTVLNPDQNPTISASGTEVDRIYNYGLPRAPRATVGTVTGLNPDQAPTVTTTTTDGDVAYNFGIPEAANFTVTDGVVSPNVSPSVSTTVTDGDVALDFSLPRTATVEVGSTTVLNPDQNPAVGSSTDADGDVTIDFDLPRAPTFAVGTVSSVPHESPATVANVGTNGDIVLDFEVPIGANAFSIGPTPPEDTGVLWGDTNEPPGIYQFYVENLLDVDYGSAPAPGDVLVWDGEYWNVQEPDFPIARLG